MHSILEDKSHYGVTAEMKEQKKKVSLLSVREMKQIQGARKRKMR